MASELNAARRFKPNLKKQSKLFDLLLARRDELLTELRQLNALIANYSGAPEMESKPKPRLIPPKKPRVRGVLSAARKAIQELPDPFTKNELLEKLVEIDGEFARKKITGANIRNALRLLTQEGVIRIQNEATARTCATYMKVA